MTNLQGFIVMENLTKQQAKRLVRILTHANFGISNRNEKYSVYGLVDKEYFDIVK